MRSPPLACIYNLGAQGSEPDGSDPIDLNRWCGGSEYECYPKSSSKCAEVSLTKLGGANFSGAAEHPTCAWPVGALSNRCNWLFLGKYRPPFLMRTHTNDC